MIETVTTATLAEYEGFIKGHPKGHFLQSSKWGRLKDSWKWEAIVSRDGEGKIRGSLAVLIRKVPAAPYTLMYAGRGPVCDSHDKETLAELTQGAKELAKKYHAYSLMMDPDIKSEDKEFISIMKDLGYKHRESGKNFEGVQPNYVFRLDVAGKTLDELKMCIRDRFLHGAHHIGKVLRSPQILAKGVRLHPQAVPHHLLHHLAQALIGLGAGRAAHLGHFIGAAVHLGCPFDAVHGMAVDVPSNLTGGAPGLGLQSGLGRNHIPPGARRQQAHIAPAHAPAILHLGLHPQGSQCRRQQSVAALFRRSAGVGSFSFEGHIEFVGGQVSAGVGAHLQGTVRGLGDVPTQHKVHIVQNARLTHRQRAPHSFFRRLEDHLHFALQLFTDAVKRQSGDQTDDRMAVVATGMHGPCVAGSKTLLLRTVSIGAVFFHIVAVNVHADGHHRPFPAGVDHGAQTGITLGALHIRGVGPLLHRPLHGLSLIHI